MKMRIARPLLLNHIVSPYGLSIFSILVFLVAWIFPPQLYSYLIDEPDLMFLDIETLLFFLICIAGFWLGLLLFDFIFPAPSLAESAPRPSPLRGFFLLFPLIVTTGLTSLEAFLIAKGSPNLLVLLLAQQGDAVKATAQEIQIGPLGMAEFLHIGVLWWTFWKLSNCRQSRGWRFVSWSLFVIGLLVKISLSVLKLSRADIMPVLGGLVVMYLFCKIQRKAIPVTRLLQSLVLFTVSGAALFVAFGFLRGSADLTSGVAGFVGYTCASYNRLTALLRGTMHYPYGGHGVYLSNYLAYDNRINAIVPLRRIFGWPDFLELWNSEFLAPQLAGLSPALIWSGAFGYLFADFGWATPAILMFYGVLYAWVWSRAKGSTALGLALYPWFAYAELSWFSVNILFDSRLFLLSITGISLMVYENTVSRFLQMRPASKSLPLSHISDQTVPGAP
jgi:hypothetical protein